MTELEDEARANACIHKYGIQVSASQWSIDMDELQDRTSKDDFWNEYTEEEKAQAYEWAKDSLEA